MRAERADFASHPPPRHLRTASISSKPTSLSAFVAFYQIASSLRKWKSGLRSSEGFIEPQFCARHSHHRNTRGSAGFSDGANLTLLGTRAGGGRKFRHAHFCSAILPALESVCVFLNFAPKVIQPLTLIRPFPRA